MRKSSSTPISPTPNTNSPPPTPLPPSAEVRTFSTYGPSHWTVLAIFLAGVVFLVLLGPRLPALFGRAFALAVLGVQLAIQVYSLVHWGLDNSLPFQLSDLAAYATAFALWSHRHWAFSLSYYWGLTLSTQALISPALFGPDFPSLG